MSRPKRSQTTWRLSSSSTGVAHIVFAGNNFEGAHLARFWRGGSISAFLTSVAESTLPQPISSRVSKASSAPPFSQRLVVTRSYSWETRRDRTLVGPPFRLPILANTAGAVP